MDNSNKYKNLKYVEDIILKWAPRESRMTSSDNEDLDKIFAQIKTIIFEDNDKKFEDFIADMLTKGYGFKDAKDYNQIKVDVIVKVINNEIQNELVKIYPKWKWEIINNGHNTYLPLALQFCKKSLTSPWGDNRFASYKFIIDYEKLTYAFNKLYHTQWEKFTKPYHSCYIEYINDDEKTQTKAQVKLKFGYEDSIRLYAFGDGYSNNEYEFEHDYSFINDMIVKYKEFVLNYKEILSNILLKLKIENKKY